MSARIGLIGVGTLGEPVARHLVAAGHDLTLFNRTRGKAEAVDGAHVAESAAALIEACDIVFLVLPTEAASDAVLEGAALAGKAIVQLATTSTGYSSSLARRIRDAGGSYVEAPISGSRIPAERGELVAMLAGEEDAKAHVRPLFDPFCAHVLDCGAVPKGLAMKLASNLVLGPVMIGIVEGMAFARRSGLDLEQFAALLNGSQMASPIMATKLAKILSGDWSPQAGISNVITSAGDAAAMAADMGMERTMLDNVIAYARQAEALGLGEEDIAALFKMLTADAPKA